MDKRTKNNVSGESVTLDYKSLCDVALIAVVQNKRKLESLLADYQDSCLMRRDDKQHILSVTRDIASVSESLAYAEEVLYTLESLLEKPEYKDFRSLLKVVNLPERVKDIKIV